VGFGRVNRQKIHFSVTKKSRKPSQYNSKGGGAPVRQPRAMVFPLGRLVNELVGAAKTRRIGNLHIFYFVPKWVGRVMGELGSRVAPDAERG